MKSVRSFDSSHRSFEDGIRNISNTILLYNDVKNHYEFTCAFCGKNGFRHNRQHPKYKFKYELKMGKAVKFNDKNYCNPECRTKASDTRIEIPCFGCGKIVLRNKAELRKSKSGRTFCNSSCAASFNNTQKRKSRRSKCEQMLFELIKDNFPHLEVVANDKKMLDGMEIDIAIPSLKLGIEWNGIVHFQPIYGQKKLDRIQELDNKKLLLAQEKGITLVIVPDLVSSEKYVKEAFREIKLKIENYYSPLA